MACDRKKQIIIYSQALVEEKYELLAVIDKYVTIRRDEFLAQAYTMADQTKIKNRQ